jgi:hypothetical protein
MKLKEDCPTGKPRSRKEGLKFREEGELWEERERERLSC